MPLTDRQKLLSCDKSLYYYSAALDSVTITRRLIEAGIDVNANFKDSKRCSEYQLYVFEDHIDVFFGCHLSPLGAIATCDNSICSQAQHARALLDAGAFPDAQRPCRFPPLLAALDGSDLEMVRCLLSGGASVNIYHGRVIGNLSLIVGLEHWEILNLMLLCGAEAESLFDRPRPQDSSTMVDCSDDSEDYVTPIRFPRVLSAWQDLRRAYDLAEIEVAQVLRLLLQFTGSVCLDEELADHVDFTDEWLSLQAIAGYISSYQCCNE